jgi:peptidoglycan hydrolase-like protein with peptidoglycan-binding domain
MFPRFVVLLFLALAPVFLHADDAVLETQKKLAGLGFYKGEADGVIGSQTSAAIRRYQIAENLKVTGQLNRQTLAQLGISGSAHPASYVPLSDIFKGGPLVSAAPEKQVAVVRQAQSNLKTLGYYKGPEDGMPNGALGAAIRIWQKSGGFRQTGRLDESTLKGLDLISK